MRSSGGIDSLRSLSRPEITATMSALDAPNPDPAGAWLRVDISMGPGGGRAATARDTSASGPVNGSRFGSRASTLAARSCETILMAGPSEEVKLTVLVTDTAALTVHPPSMSKYRGYRSVVPPARSILFGA